MRKILIVLLLATSLFGQANVSVVKIETERTQLSKPPNAAPKLIEHDTYYLAGDGRQRHEITQVDTDKTTVQITLWAERRQIFLDAQTKQASVLPAVAPPMPPTERMGRMVVPQSKTDLDTKIVHGLTLYGTLLLMPYPQGTVRNEVWDYRGSVQSTNVPPIIVESRWDAAISTEEERIAGVSNVLVPASMFELPVDFVVNGRDAASTARLLDQLAAAEAKWAANTPSVYEFHIGQICFCGPIPPGREPIVFRVEDGTPSLVSGARAFSFRKYLENYNTIEKLFAYIRGELAKHDYRVEVDYDADADFGYPKRIFTDPSQNTADDEMTFVIQGFKVVAR